MHGTEQVVPSWSYWIPVIAAAVTAIVAFAVAVANYGLSRRLERLKADLEQANIDHKAVLDNAADEWQSKLNKAVEHYKSELSRANADHHIRFSKLHEKRTEVVADLFRHICDIESKLTRFSWSDWFFDEMPHGEQHSQEEIAQTLTDFMAYFTANSIYLQDDLSRRIIDFFGYCTLVYQTQAAFKDHQHFRQVEAKQFEELKSIKRTIEGELRMLLGVVEKQRRSH